MRDNGKQRLQVVGDRIRCSQGHSLDGTPVTLEALEASWRPLQGDDWVWHGTKVDAALAIATSGQIGPRGRTHVHLAAALDAVVGKRHGTPVMLGLRPSGLEAAGLRLFCSPNGVILARRVPASAIERVVLRSRSARGRRDELSTAWPQARVE